MDIAKIVDELIEKKISDYVDSELRSKEIYDRSAQQVAESIISDKIKEKIEEMRPQIMKTAEDYLNRCKIGIGFGGYHGLSVEVTEPRKVPDGEK